MSKVEKQLIELTEIAKEFRAYSKSRFGWDTQYFTDKNLQVRCYFADNSDHTSVGFNGISIGFFSSPKYEMTMQDVRNLSSIIDNAREFLAVLKNEALNEDVAEVESRKAERKKVLLEELKQLEADK